MKTSPSTAFPRPFIALALLSLTGCDESLFTAPGDAGQVDDCTALSEAAVRYEHPVSGDSVYALTMEEVAAARALGFTVLRGVAFRGAREKAQGFEAVTRLYNDGNHDHVFTTDPALISRLKGEGYLEQPMSPLFVSGSPGPCLVPVWSLFDTANLKHRLTTSEAERDALLAVEWEDDGVAFHARAGDGYTPPVSGPEEADAGHADAGPDDAGLHDAGSEDAGRADAGPLDAGQSDAGPNDAGAPDAGRVDAGPAPTDAGHVDAGMPVPDAGIDTRFTLVVMPDTQREVNSAAKAPRFANRMEWVKAKRAALDIRYVVQVGDLEDWDTADHIMYERTSAGLAILDDAGIPYALVPGNHDTNAVGIGGSACTPTGTPTCPTVPQALRITDTFNHYYPVSRFPNLGGTYETGKIDNAFHTFSAGGVNWLILALELWPRTAVVTWAKSVVASHPHHNVIVITHSHLNSSGGIEQTNGGYGANSPQYVFDNLLKVYPNVLMVLSGHVGIHGYRVDTGTGGNKIYSFMQTYHDEVTNPSRLLEIDTAQGTIGSKVYAPFDDSTKNDGSTFTVTGVQFVH